MLMELSGILSKFAVSSVRDDGKSADFGQKFALFEADNGNGPVFFLVN